MSAKSPLDHLPRRSMFADAEPKRLGFTAAEIDDFAAQMSRVSCAAPKATKPEKSAVLSIKSKGGRPPKHPDKPWIAAGVSRMTWYRRNKKAQTK